VRSKALEAGPDWLPVVSVVLNVANCPEKRDLILLAYLQLTGAAVLIHHPWVVMQLVLFAGGELWWLSQWDRAPRPCIEASRAGLHFVTPMKRSVRIPWVEIARAAVFERPRSRRLPRIQTIHLVRRNGKQFRFTFRIDRGAKEFDQIARELHTRVCEHVLAGERVRLLQGAELDFGAVTLRRSELWYRLLTGWESMPLGAETSTAGETSAAVDSPVRIEIKDRLWNPLVFLQLLEELAPYPRPRIEWSRSGGIRAIIVWKRSRDAAGA
jgi:hypothetical protein